MSENFKEGLGNEEMLTEQNDSGEAAVLNEVAEILPEQNIADDQEGIVSPEEGQELFEMGEQAIAIDQIASGIARDTGKTFTPEEIIGSDKPEVKEEISGWLDRHPKARRALQIFALSTALAGAAAPEEAKADVVGDIVNTVAQGFLQQGDYASRHHVRTEHQREQRYIELERQRMNVPSQEQRIHDTYEQRRADLHHRAKMRKITDPHIRAELELNYQEQRALRNVDIQVRQREQKWVNQDEIAAMRADEQMRHTGQNIQVNTVNRVIQQGTNDFLRQILTGR